jgi:hypothetical protein
MTTNLSGWKRLWIFASALLLVALLIRLTQLWPMSDPDVVAGIVSTDCEHLRTLPKGFFPEKATIYGNDCDALNALMHFSQVNISSRSDYQDFLNERRLIVSFQGLLIWLGLSVALYLVGWAIGWVVAGFRRVGA